MCGDLTESAPTVVLDESSLLRVLHVIVNRCILTQEDTAPREGDASAAADAALEQQMEMMWSLCVDRNTAAFVVGSSGVDILIAAARKAEHEGRVAEVCLGTLANIYSHSTVASTLGAVVVELAAAALQGASSTDGRVVTQGLRLTVALLCGEFVTNCECLWGDAPLERYMFVIRSALHWGAVQYACDALSQILVVHSTRDTGLCDATLTGVRAALVDRSDDLIKALNVDFDMADGHPEAALLSALYLFDSVLTVAPLADVAVLAAMLRVLKHAEKPRVLIAALEVFLSLLEAYYDEQEDDAQCVDNTFLNLASGFASTSDGFVEKTAMLLTAEEAMESRNAVAAALWLLQGVPQSDVAEHAEVFEAAVAELDIKTLKWMPRSFFAKWKITVTEPA